MPLRKITHFIFLYTTSLNHEIIFIPCKFYNNIVVYISIRNILNSLFLLIRSKDILNVLYKMVLILSDSYPLSLMCSVR